MTAKNASFFTPLTWEIPVRFFVENLDNTADAMQYDAALIFTTKISKNVNISFYTTHSPPQISLLDNSITKLTTKEQAGTIP